MIKHYICGYKTGNNSRNLIYMASIYYSIRTKNNPATIYLRLKGEGAEHKLKTSFKVDPSRWTTKKPLSKGVTVEDKQLDDKLENLSIYVKRQFRATKKNELQNRDWLEKAIFDFVEFSKDYYDTFLPDNWLEKLTEQINPDTPVNDLLVDYFDTYLDWKKNDVSKGFEKRIKVVKHFIERMQAHYNEAYRFKDVDAEFMQNLKVYAEEHGYAKNTIALFFKFTKIVCNHAAAYSKGQIQVSPELSTDEQKKKFKFTRVENIILKNSEIERIKKQKLPERLDNARDWLLISCFTGQRVSDFMRFNSEMLRTEGGQLLIEFTQEKTDKKIVLPILPEVKRILDKRGGEFPRPITDQRYNKQIKEVCMFAKINERTHGRKRQPGKNSTTIEGMFPKYELVASHIGRRSFATNFYGDIPTALLNAATGHSTEKQFLEYINKEEKELAMQLAEYFKKLKK